MASLFKKAIGKLYRFVYPPPSSKIVSLQTQAERKGNLLLSYVIEPFLLKAGEAISNAHTHDWESVQIAQTFLNLGYDVDIVDYDDRRFEPDKSYSFFVSARTNFQRLSTLLNEDCVKIVHLDMAHWLFNNLAAYKRLLSFQQRKKITLSNIKFQEINWAIESADYATILGNQFTIDTYLYAGKPIFRVPISTCATYPSPENKGFDGCRTNFLWLGSSGLVHKGLDLVLDAFLEMPDHHLYVLGPISEEKAFESAYDKALYHTPNIHTLGWVDVTGDDFIDVANQCIAIVYPSCAEGGGGSVINCLHAGLIPIISYESSVDVGNFGIILKDCTPNEIKASIQKLSQMPAGELKKMSTSAWEFANANQHERKICSGIPANNRKNHNPPNSRNVSIPFVIF